jgi:hypothetical protein
MAGSQEVGDVTARVQQTLGKKYSWCGMLARRYAAAFSRGTRPRLRDVLEFLRQDEEFERACIRHRLSIAQWLTQPGSMQPVSAAASWKVPAIESAGALADWLQLPSSEIDWFADLKSLSNKVKDHSKLRHYHYRVLTKRNGGFRLIEAPKPRLKIIQRKILSEILDCIPSHPAVHGFIKGRSIRTFVAPHAGKRAVLRMDLQDFFPTIAGVRVQALFRTAGYPESVADLMGGICTNAAPRDIWNIRVTGVDIRAMTEARNLYARPHVPQGAPTLPALANLCAYRLDCRLAGLARSANAEYTRYADDLAFSGGVDFERAAHRFSAHVAAILLEEGFGANHRKTRLMRQGVRQHLAGLVTNQAPNIIRADFDRLKAILTNCVRHGPETQNGMGHSNFQAHLEGRVAFVESIHPLRGCKLRAIMERINWT